MSVGKKMGKPVRDTQVVHMKDQGKPVEPKCLCKSFLMECCKGQVVVNTYTKRKGTVILKVQTANCASLRSLHTQCTLLTCSLTVRNLDSQSVVLEVIRRVFIYHL